MAGTAACGITTTNTGRLVSGCEREAIGAAVKGVNTELGDDDCLGRGDALLRIEARPDVVSDSACTICWTGVVSPVVCTSGAKVVLASVAGGGAE